MLFYNEAPIYLHGSYSYSNRPVGFTSGFQKLLEGLHKKPLSLALNTFSALAYFVAVSIRVECKCIGTYLQ